MRWQQVRQRGYWLPLVRQPVHVPRRQHKPLLRQPRRVKKTLSTNSVPRGHHMTETAEDLGGERKRGSGVRLVYEMLRDEILTLALPPGRPIDEVNLAERFGMSRTPI